MDLDLETITSISSIVANICVVITTIIAVFEIIKMRRSMELNEENAKITRMSFLADNTRKKRQSTIDFFDQINLETKPLIDSLVINKKTLSLDEILSNEKLEVDIRRYLSLMERISVGIQSYMYDLQVLDRMHGETTLLVDDKLKEYISYIDKKYGEHFYGDYKHLISEIRKLRARRLANDYSGENEVFNKHCSFDECEE